MTIQRRLWLTAVGMALGLPGLATAQEVVWRAARRAPAPVTTAAALGRPVAVVPAAASPSPAPPPARVPVVRARSADFDPGAPPPPEPPAPPPAPLPSELQPISYFPGSEVSFGVAPVAAEGGITTPIGEPPPPSPPPSWSAESFPPPPPVGYAPPQPAIPPLTPHHVSGPPDALPPPPTAPFSPAEVTPGVMTDRPVAPGFWEKCRDWTRLGDQGSASGRKAFQSDHCFQAMVSPVTMPFYFEDPRAVTEARPIFIYQSIPGGTPNFNGGNVYYFGSQFRLAFTDRLSVVIHDLGGLWLEPSGPVPPVQSGSGLAEIRMGPKYTFLRNANSGTVAAAGLIFELPIGSASVFQDTGTLGLVPYVTIAQTFGQLPSGFGSFNLMASLGYSFSIDDKRSEFLYSNWHLDYNIANTNTFYPFLEVNWIYYTSYGNSTDLGTEGADLINFGSRTRQGSNYFSVAPGFRYRCSDHFQAGVAVEFPISNEKGLNDYRMTFDVIFRY